MTPRLSLAVLGAGLLAWLGAAISCQAATTLHDGGVRPIPGINLTSGAFAPEGTRREFDYTYPTTGDIDYFTSKGFKILRISVLAKRLVQPDGAGGFEPADDMAIVTNLIDYAAIKDASVLLDIHDYGRSISGRLIGRDTGATEEFAASWRAIAKALAKRPNVIFGLMNEPHDQTAAEWLEGANAAAKAIRGEGAYQLILVPGSYWDSAWLWTTTDNKAVMLDFDDPAKNFAIEVHQYLDPDGSGTHPEVVPDSGINRLTAFTTWAREHGVRAFLGEFGWAATKPALKEGRDMLCLMSRNEDVWLGWAYFAAGPWWGDYMFSVQPEQGVDKPQMAVLQQFMQAKPPPDCAPEDRILEDRS